MKNNTPMRRLFYGSTIGILMLLSSVAVSGSKHIKICSDSNFWFPYTFEVDGESKGLHVDMVNAAIESLGLKVTIDPLPWKRCLYSAEIGLYDAVISASYKSSRAKYLFYPEDAATKKSSKYRITQVKYTIISHKSEPFDFIGEFSSIPEPVRVPFGYSIADDLTKKGLLVETSTKGIKSNLHQLIKSKMGSIVTTQDIAQLAVSNSSLRLHVSHKPLTSKSYFMAFSKNTVVNETLRVSVWQAIADIRSDPKKSRAMLAPYENYDPCVISKGANVNKGNNDLSDCD